MKKSLIGMALLAVAACAALVGYVSQSIPVMAAVPLALGIAIIAANPFGLGDKAAELLFGHLVRTGAILSMTTLAANKPRAYEQGNRGMYPVIASDIIYEGGAVGLVAGTGHARPLSGGDAFGGFAVYKADNSAGSAADINVETQLAGEIELSVSGAVITDVRQPVYATDDDTFVFNPVGATFIGFVKRFVSSGVAVVEFDAIAFRDPWAAFTVRETLSANKTLDAEDSGKLFWVDTDAFTITLPVIATGLDGFAVVNGGAFGAVAVTISPAAADMILGPDITGADDKDLINTKATAKRGDFVILGGNDADGYAVQSLRGTWARQA